MGYLTLKIDRTVSVDCEVVVCYFCHIFVFMFAHTVCVCEYEHISVSECLLFLCKVIINLDWLVRLVRFTLNHTDHT